MIDFLLRPHNFRLYNVKTVDPHSYEVTEKKEHKKEKRYINSLDEQLYVLPFQLYFNFKFKF